MKFHHLALVAAFAVVGAVLAADPVTSGPQVGDNARPKPFFPLNINGPEATKKSCLVCRNGDNPVVMVFAREVSSPLTTLIKKVDAETTKNKEKKMGSFAVFCSDSEGLDKKLTDLAKKEEIKDFVLAIDNPAGPEPYKISKDADVTVVLYNKSKVVANFTFKKGELDDKAIEKILKEVPKILEK
ncbi:MAG: hypothetical protein K2R98_28460 [Gemmataceae bacterium]|nr:hypothetical protein [Gemmataceae bacterium]